MNSNKQILVVDDDPHLRKLLSALYIREGYGVQAVPGLLEARELLSQKSFSLVLVDLNLIGETGLDLVAELRGHRGQLGVIIISARDEVTDRIIGLEMGADDYVTKPIDLRELLIRSKRLMERLGDQSKPESMPTILSFKGLVIDPARRSVITVDGSNVAATTKEFQLLCVLAHNPGRVVNRDQISQVLHGREWQANDRSIDMVIRRLKAKLAAYNLGNAIENVRGQGYVFTLPSSA